ncbi:MAG: hypothetical protein AAF531_01555 [Actinomycetota bacterium]
MTTQPSAPPSPAGPIDTRPDDKPRTPGALGALYRLVLRHQLTRGRLALFAAIFGVSILMGWVAGRNNPNRIEDAVNLVSAVGLGLIVPVVALVLGSAALGNWVDDETLVYVWLRPVRRWVIAVAATLASLTVAVPIVSGSQMVLVALGSGGDGRAIAATAAGTALGATAYTALFVALGLVIKRALLWGLVYVFIWEFFVARAGAGAARLSINSYASSILARLSEVDIRLADRGLTTSYIVLLAIAAVSLGFTTWRLARANVA